MTEKLAGITLKTGDDYGPWHAGMGENYVNVADDLADAYDIYDAGKLPFIHLMFHIDRQPGCTIRKIAARDYDTLLEAWALKLKEYLDTGRKAIIAYLPEMNGNWCPAYATDDYSMIAFKQAWQNFARILGELAIDKTQALLCWAPNDTGWGRLSDWYPGLDGGVVDLIGGSAYNWGGFEPVFDEPWESFTFLADRYVTEIRGFTDKPIVITQTGCARGDSRAEAWLEDAVFYTLNYTNIDGFIYFNIGEFGWAAGQDDYNDRVEPLSSARPDHWFDKEEPVTSIHPDAIQVIACNGTRQGKPWIGGTGAPKLLLHTIEGADENIGWPRDWTRWCATPHLALHPWKYGRGEPGGLYQLVGMEWAAYALRDNAGEDDKFIWQVEMAGRAVNVPTYDDDWYRGVAKLVKWFIDNMGVPDVYANFASPTRMDSAEWNAFSGIMGHVHFGAGVDTHTDPGKLDVGRVRSFYEGGAVDLGRLIQYVQEGDSGMAVEEAQVKIIMAVKGISYYGTSNRQFVENESNLTFKVWDSKTTQLFSSWTGRNSYGMGPTEQILVDEAIRQL